jgi:3-dehydroquinate synthase II
MSLSIYCKVIPFDKKLVTLALESGVDGVLVQEEETQEVAALGRTEVYAPEDFEHFQLTDKEKENEAASALKSGKNVLLQEGWEIIPVENLLAVNQGKLGVEISSLEQARLAAGILERGVDFLVLLPAAMPEIKQIVSELKLSQGVLELEKGKITGIKPIGLGHRVCVDTCTLLRTGQGLLVGNSSGFTFLVHGETEENPYVAARPFRINAGAVHAYVLRPGDKTSYLEELKSGDEVMLVDYKGESSLATVGRVKTEIRPLLLIEAVIGERKGQVILQNAETIRLVNGQGQPVSVVNLKEGDEVFCRTDQAGRHFGMRIAEEIKEG